ncbi:Kinesin-like protein kif15 [Coemansia linderi]|uniref:Kinesin-like protein kif15 n=1 Tax=Coemansia linderi TaxID=2663919 RepID=A0ACC1KH40_9FUNG|nr:Kinesin-like protein kif15 [Coemansia linderi]
MIRNKAVVNQDMQGNVPQLQAEISRLKLQIAQMRSNGSSGMDSSLGGSEYTVSPYPETVVSSDPGGIGVGPAGLSSKEVGAMQYFVRLALRKERESERQKAYYSEKMIQLKFSLARHRRHLQQQTLVLKLAKAECETLRRNASIAYVASAENNALREEITVLQAALSAQPDSTDLIIENFQLREELEAMADRQAIRDLPDLADAVEALDTLFSSKVNVMDLKADFPIIPDDAVYMGLEEKIKLKQDDIADLKLQRDKLEFQIKSIEEDWQSVNEGTHKLSTAATDEQVDTIIEKTMDSIVGDQARDTWTAISSLFTRTF